jgi:hypothetical protein
MHVRSLAAALRGNVAGRDQVLCPGPGHSPRDRSVSVRLHRAMLAANGAGDRIQKRRMKSCGE